MANESRREKEIQSRRKKSKHSWIIVSNLKTLLAYNLFIIVA